MLTIDSNAAIFRTLSLINLMCYLKLKMVSTT